MLQEIRDRIQSWVMYTIIILLTIAFSFWGFERFFSGSDSTAARVVARINGYEITQQQLQAAYERVKQNLPKQLTSQLANPAFQQQLKEQSLQMLIQNYVLSTRAKREGYTITMPQIDSVLAGIQAFQVDGKFSPERFQQVLDSLFYTEADFIQQLRQTMLIDQLQTGIMVSAFGLPEETKQLLKLADQQRSFHYAVIHSADFLPKITINPEEIKQYYLDNQNQFMIPEQVRIAYVLLDMQVIKKNIEISDQAEKQYYQDNITSFTEPKAWKIAQIVINATDGNNTNSNKQTEEKINQVENLLQKNPNQFNKIAKEYSDDVFTAKNGGELPWISALNLPQNLAETITRLKVGEISKPIQTQQGWLIIKLIAQKPEKVKPLSQVSAQIRQLLQQQQASKIFADQSEQLANITYANPDSLQAAEQTLKLKIHTTQFFPQSGGDDSITRNPKIIAAAFSNDVLQNHNNSDIINLNDNQAMVLRVIQHQPQAVKKLEVVTPAIEQILKKQKAEALAMQYGEKILAQLKAGKNLIELEKMDHLKVMHAINIKRTAKNIDSNIVTSAFSLPAPNEQNKQRSYVGIPLQNGDYALIQLNSVQLSNQQFNLATLSAAQTALANVFGSYDFQAYQDQAMQQAKITILMKNEGAV